MYFKYVPTVKSNVDSGRNRRNVTFFSLLFFIKLAPLGLYLRMSWVHTHTPTHVLCTLPVQCFFCVCLSITLVCSFSDVQTDTSALDAYRPSRCGCTCPILSKVCLLDVSSWTEQRHSWHWITSVDLRCFPSHPLSPVLSSSFLSSFSSSGHHPMGCALHRAHGGIIHGTALLLLSVLVPWF